MQIYVRRAIFLFVVWAQFCSSVSNDVAALAFALEAIAQQIPSSQDGQARCRGDLPYTIDVGGSRSLLHAHKALEPLQNYALLPIDMAFIGADDEFQWLYPSEYARKEKLLFAPVNVGHYDSSGEGYTFVRKVHIAFPPENFVMPQSIMRIVGNNKNVVCSFAVDIVTHIGQPYNFVFHPWLLAIRNKINAFYHNGFKSGFSYAEDVRMGVFHAEGMVPAGPDAITFNSLSIHSVNPHDGRYSPNNAHCGIAPGRGVATGWLVAQAGADITVTFCVLLATEHAVATLQPFIAQAQTIGDLVQNLYTGGEILGGADKRALDQAAFILCSAATKTH